MSEQSPRIAGLLAENVEFSKTYEKPRHMKEMRVTGGERVMVVTCMDPRVVPEQFFGPKSRMAVVRNAGGRYSADAVRSITILRTLALGDEKFNLLVVHHEDCGMGHVTNEEVRKDIEKRNPNETNPIREFGLVPLDDIEKTVLEDVAAFKADSLLAGVNVKGYMMSHETGLVREVV